MKNKEIQEKRMRGYFIEATREILKGEGIRSVNVRNIADKAGYSYATLYNYFKDVKELVFYCVEDFYKELTAFADKQSADHPHGLERIKSRVEAYVTYFVQYPGIFELFFIERLGDLGHKRATLDLITSGLDTLCESDWGYCLEEKILSIAQVDFLKTSLKHAIPGMLLLYLNRLTPSDYHDFMMQAKNYLDGLLKPEK